MRASRSRCDPPPPTASRARTDAPCCGTASGAIGPWPMRPTGVGGAVAGSLVVESFEEVRCTEDLRRTG